MNNSGDKIIQQQVGNMQVSFDKEAAWLRLQEKMESRDEKKGYFRLGWVAAAVILLGLGAWYGISGTKKNLVAKENVEKKNTSPVTIVEPQKAEQELPAAVIETTAPAEGNRIVHTALKPVTKEPVEEKKIVAQHEQIESPAIDEPVAITDNVPKAITIAKPKLEVMHINVVVEEEKRERTMRNSRYAVEKINYDEIFEDPMIPKNPFKIYISRQN